MPSARLTTAGHYAYRTKEGDLPYMGKHPAVASDESQCCTGPLYQLANFLNQSWTMLAQSWSKHSTHSRAGINLLQGITKLS